MLCIYKDYNCENVTEPTFSQFCEIKSDQALTFCQDLQALKGTLRLGDQAEVLQEEWNLTLSQRYVHVNCCVPTVTQPSYCTSSKVWALLLWIQHTKLLQQSKDLNICEKCLKNYPNFLEHMYCKVPSACPLLES